MKVTLSHPLWTHIPAMAALAVLVGLLAAANPLPAEAPTHFGPSGLPDQYGSPAGVFALIIGLSIVFILLSVCMDESWTRHEKEKRFNYFTLLDEIVVSAMAGMATGYLGVIQLGQPVYTFPAVEMLSFAVPTIGAAILLEKARPFSPREETVVSEDTTALRRELGRRLKSGAALAYSDIQNPLYMNIVAAGVPAALLISTALTVAAQPLWATMLNVTLALVFASFYGGMRTVVTRDQIAVRFGTPGLRVLRLSPAEVTEVALRRFLPLQEFGGYGIRRNSQMSGYFLKGGVGVEIATAKGRRLLIGSEHPERLAEVIGAVAGLPATPSSHD